MNDSRSKETSLDDAVGAAMFGKETYATYKREQRRKKIIGTVFGLGFMLCVLSAMILGVIALAKAVL
jgi:hypothetical protein